MPAALANNMQDVVYPRHANSSIKQSVVWINRKKFETFKTCVEFLGLDVRTHASSNPSRDVVHLKASFQEI